MMSSSKERSSLPVNSYPRGDPETVQKNKNKIQTNGEHYITPKRRMSTPPSKKYELPRACAEVRTVGHVIVSGGDLRLAFG